MYLSAGAVLGEPIFNALGYPLDDLVIQVFW